MGPVPKPSSPIERETSGSAGREVAAPGDTEASSPDTATRDRLVGDSPAMQRLREVMLRVAGRDCTVLIQGPTGTGKELVARALHQGSRRTRHPFVPVDCTTLRDTLFESQLFGHIRGAFTGAERDSLGFIRSADRGTVFLDEVGELPLETQAKLLRVLQEQQVVPVGATRGVPINTRFLAATHRDLRAMVARGEFRSDLYFRLNVVQLDVPALVDRHGDVPALIDYRLARLAALYEEPVRRFDGQAHGQLLAYPWPGNVRQLNNAVEHAFVLSEDDPIPADALPTYLRESLQASNRDAAATAELTTQTRLRRPTPASSIDLGVMPLEAAQRMLVTNALRATRGHQGQAAELLQIERRRMYRFVQKYDLDPKAIGHAPDLDPRHG